MKYFKKVLRNVSEAVFERFFVIPNYGDVREEMRLLKQFLHDFEIIYNRFLVNIFISVI